MFPLLLHQVSLPLRYESQFPTNKSLSHVLALWLVVHVLHHGIEALPSQEASRQTLYFDHHGHKVSLLTLKERLLIVVRMAANGTCFIHMPLGLLELFKIL